MSTQSNSHGLLFNRVTDVRVYLGVSDDRELPIWFQAEVRQGKRTLSTYAQLGYETDTKQVTLYVEVEEWRGACFYLLEKNDDREGSHPWLKFAQRIEPTNVIYVMLTEKFR